MKRSGACARLTTGIAEELHRNEEREHPDRDHQDRQHPGEEPLEEPVDRQHVAILPGAGRARSSEGGWRPMGEGGDMLPRMETPMDETEQTPHEDETTTTRPASETEAYESEWYEVLKRRAEELEDEDDEGDEDEA